MSVMDELCLCLSLFGYLNIDLTRPWAAQVVATDGAQDFGFGMACASCHPSWTRRMAAHCSDRVSYQVESTLIAHPCAQSGTHYICRTITMTSSLAYLCARRCATIRQRWKLLPLHLPCAESHVRSGTMVIVMYFFLTPRHFSLRCVRGAAQVEPSKCSCRRQGPS